MATKRVLLTGAHSLIGSHILDRLLAYNVSVRAVVASREEAHDLRLRYHSTDTHRLDFAIVSSRDLLLPGAYDDALDSYPQPFDTVIHTVAADPSEEADCLSRFIHLETETLINFVRNVKDVAKNVRKVVITTSLTPFARWLVDPQAERSPQSPRGARPSSQPAAEIDSDYILATSQASDNIVYDALCEWIKNASVDFDLVSIAAPSVYGPSIRPLNNSSDLEEANRRIWNICSSEYQDSVTSPPYGIDFFTDVRDLASASVQALFMPQTGNRRFVITAGTMPARSVIGEFLVHRFPELGSRVRFDGSPPRRLPSDDILPGFTDAQLAASALGLTRYRPVEETLTDLMGQILELHRRKEWKRVIQS